MSLSFTTPDSSAATVVTTLNVDPGGWGEEYAIPATPNTEPSLASSTATPPNALPSAVTAASCNTGSIVVRTGSPLTGSALASTRLWPPPPASLEASNSPPGWPASRVLNAFSSPLFPASAPSGNPRCSSFASSAPFGTPSSPATLIVAPLIGELRAEAGPSASGVPFLARIGARSGTSMRRERLSPSDSPGNTRWGAHAISPSATGIASVPPTSPNAWVRTSTGTVTASWPETVSMPSGSCGSTDSIVAVRSASSYRVVKRSIGYLAAVSSVSSPCIAS